MDPVTDTPLGRAAVALLEVLMREGPQDLGDLFDRPSLREHGAHLAVALDGLSDHGYVRYVGGRYEHVPQEGSD